MGDGEQEPSDLNNIKDRKLTRRRIMQAATAIGFSSPVVMNMSVNDVKAADSDQVTVSFDVSGNTKYTVAADRMDWLQKAKSANEHIKNKYYQREGILGVGMSGGKGEDNPHVVVSLDRDNNSSEERRGELPEEHNGIRIETQERDKEETHLCNEDCIPESEKFPGGQSVNPAGAGSCTSSSMVLEDNFEWIGWSTAAHCFSNCEASNDDVDHVASQDCVYQIGDGDFADITRDIAFIEGTKADESPLNLKPNDHSEGVEIIDTLTEEGFGIIDDEGSVLFNYGIGSCFAEYDLERWNEQNNSSATCNDTYYDQMITTHRDFNGMAEDGDSGSLWFVEDPYVSGNYYAMGSISAFYFRYYRYEHSGPQGFTIYNRYNRAWRN